MYNSKVCKTCCKNFSQFCGKKYETVIYKERADVRESGFCLYSNSGIVCLELFPGSSAVEQLAVNQ